MGGLVIDVAVLWVCARLANLQSGRTGTNGEQIFSLPWVVLTGWIASVPLAVWLCMAVNKGSPFSWWGVLALGGAIAWIVFSIWQLPGTIVVADEAIEQKYWLRQNRRITWKSSIEVLSRTVYQKRLAILVRGPDGQEVVHTPYHVGRNQFIAALRQHCRASSIRLKTDHSSSRK